MNNKPLNKFRDKGISLTLWNSRNGGYQIKLEKSYKAKDSDEWKKTDSYFPDELERLEKLCADARRWIHEQGQERSINGGQIDDEPLPDFDDSEIPF
jgi:hypothetical protein